MIASFLLPQQRGLRHSGCRRLLSMTLFGSPLPCGYGSPNKL